MKQWLGVLVGIGVIISAQSAMAEKIKQGVAFLVPPNMTITRSYTCPKNLAGKRGRYVAESGRAVWDDAYGCKGLPTTTGVKISNRQEIDNGYQATISNNMKCEILPVTPYIALYITLQCRYPDASTLSPDARGLDDSEEELDDELMEDLFYNFLQEEGK